MTNPTCFNIFSVSIIFNTLENKLTSPHLTESANLRINLSLFLLSHASLITLYHFFGIMQVEKQTYFHFFLGGNNSLSSCLKIYSIIFSFALVMDAPM